jgi:hypothetical protein
LKRRAPRTYAGGQASPDATKAPERGNIVDYTYLSLAILVFLSLLLRFVFPRLLRQSGPLYTRRESLFTAAELRFLETLRRALPTGLEIFGKVRVADVLKPVERLDPRAWRSAFVRITGKHLDFVLCERETGRLICAIELNDRSHARPDRQERDRFIVQACAEAGFPLLMIAAARSYDVSELRRQILEAAGERPAESSKPIDRRRR